MKKLVNIFTVLVISLFFLGESGIQAQTKVSSWGKTSLGTAWPLIPNATAGSAGMGNGAVPTGWSTIRGQFDTLTATTTQAVVVTGQMQFVGGGGASAYTWLRYGLTFQDSTTLNYAGTDSATWVSPNKNYGYSFMPRSGAGTMANGAGGEGTVWTVNNGNWTSTYSNNGGPVSSIKNEPYNAEAIAGTYNFAFSVESVNDTVNEVRWYLIEQNNKYWFGGTIQVLSTTKKFNAVDFGFNNDFQGTQVNYSNVTASLGTPITVPAAPWQAFYASDWGKTSLGTAWPVIWNDSTTIVGNAGLGDGKVPTGWATISAGFGDSVTISTSKAIIVTGQMEFVGGGGASAYTWLRYALTYQDSLTLKYKGTDSAMWSSPKKWYGYEFDPISGSGTMSNTYLSWPQGNQGTVWGINNGGWTSTNSNGTGPLSQIKNQPYNAAAIAGTYNFAISVISINDTVNEVRWYLIEQNNKYWFGGTIQVPSYTKKFNAIDFGFGSDFQGTQINFSNVQVDLGAPITVPAAPWQAYYVSDWGKTSLGTAWPVLWNDSTTIVGNAGLGNGKVPTGWATISGGFGQNIPITTSKAIIVTGQMEFVGGGGASAYTWLRYALTYQDSLMLKNKGTDSATWSSPKKWYGYEFDPRSGAGTIANGSGGQGTIWAVNNGSWASTYSNGGPFLTTVLNQPYNAEAAAGTYNFAISVESVNDTVNEVRWYMIEQNNKYWFGGIIRGVSTTKMFNAINFGFNNDFQGTQVNFSNVQVDLGAPITIPVAPWQDYYINEWGIYQNQMGGWTFQPGGVVGNAGIGGSKPSTGWAEIRGGFGASPIASRNAVDSVLVIKGDLQFNGGGFEKPSSLRIGLTYNPTPGSVKVISDTVSGVVYDSTRWNGSGTSESGYLFVPVSGSNQPLSWGSAPGTFGGIINGAWDSTATGYILGNNPQAPANAVGSAGLYHLTISVTPSTGGAQIIAYQLQKDDKSYMIQGVATDNHSPLPTTSFNGINIALGTGNADTSLSLQNFEVTLGKPLVITGVENTLSTLPMSYSLSQNYPNPFNPSTTIDFALPKSGNVTLTVYDILGREVAHLVNGDLQAGYHKIQFNASTLASGVYFYRLKAGDFVNVKKLMLLK